MKEQKAQMAKYYKIQLNQFTHKQERVEGGIAEFIGFGIDSKVFGQGVAQFTTAILKEQDGNVKMVRADLIQFIN